MQQKKPNKFVRVLRWCLYYLILIPVISLVDKIAFGLKIEGREHFRQVKGAVLVCNHVHFLDCSMVAVAAWPTRITFASQNSNFQLPIAGWLLKQFQCIPVGESLKETKAFFLETKEKLLEGLPVGIFPEGELQMYSKEIRPFRKGAFTVSASANIPVLPMILKQRPPHGIWKLWKRKPLFTLQIFPPVQADSDLPQKEKYHYLEQNVRKVMVEGLQEKSLERAG